MTNAQGKTIVCGIVTVCISVVSILAASRAQVSRVAIVRLPAGGIQPQVALDAKGTAHIVYFSGDPANGDLFYTTLRGADEFSPSVRVTAPGSAIATGTIRGARLALGANGRVHVVWNGSGRATPKAPGDSTPLLYSRFDPGRGAFEPQRNLIQLAVGLDGGGAIAADGRGRVFVAWHAGGPDSKGEGDRRVWLVTSRDDGDTFSRDVAISDQSTGACGCCGMDGLVDRSGSLFFLYRSARDVVHRDSYLLASNDGGRRFSSAKLDEWAIRACPMSSFDVEEGTDGLYAAWETNGQVRFARIAGNTQSPELTVVEPPGSTGKRRHPALAINDRGEMLLAWSEGTAWQKGGGIAWQVFDRTARPISQGGRSEGMPVWGLAAAFAGRDGRFTIVY